MRPLVFLLALLAAGCGLKLDTVEKKYAAAYASVDVAYTTLTKVVRTTKPDGFPVLTKDQATLAKACIDKAKDAVDDAWQGAGIPDVTIADRILQALNLLISSLDAVIAGQNPQLVCKVT